MSLTGSGDAFCGPTPALFQAAAYHPPTVGLLAFPAVCLLKVYMEISSLFLPPSPVCFQPLLCASFQFIAYSVFFFFTGGWYQSSQGAMLVYPRGGSGNIT
jgi:hypothetical protein